MQGHIQQRGELLALRGGDIDSDGGKLRGERYLEQTKAGSLRFIAPRTRHGRRSTARFCSDRWRNRWHQEHCNRGA